MLARRAKIKPKPIEIPYPPKLDMYLFTLKRLFSVTRVAIAPATMTPIENPLGIALFILFKQARTIDTIAAIMTNHPSPW